MIDPSDPIVRFHQLTGRGRAPMRADRSAMGTLPMRAVRYCEALTSATAFGWWLFPPIGIEMLWDGSEIFCAAMPRPIGCLCCRRPSFPTMRPNSTPSRRHRCRAARRPSSPLCRNRGTVQLWTGLIAQTAPDWHLLLPLPGQFAPGRRDLPVRGDRGNRPVVRPPCSPICASPAATCPSACATTIPWSRSSRFHDMPMPATPWTVWTSRSVWLS